MFQFIVEFTKDQGGLSPDVINKAFNATEEEFICLVKKKLPFRPEIGSVGSCCLVGAISNDTLHIANLGDSRVILGRKISEGQRQTVVAERLSRDHNVADEEVRKEVKALHADDSSILDYCGGVWRIKGIIQVICFSTSQIKIMLSVNSEFKCFLVYQNISFSFLKFSRKEHCSI